MTEPEKQPAMRLNIVNLETATISREIVRQVSTEELKRLERKGHIRQTKEMR